MIAEKNCVKFRETNEDEKVFLFEEDIGQLKQATVIFSNQIEQLAFSLKKNLYERQGSPFLKKWIVVPSRGIKYWLERTLASEGIFFGIEVIPLDKALKRLLKEGHVPTNIELQLAIIEALQLFPDVEMSQEVNLAALFKRYALYGYECFEKWQKESVGWQHQIWNHLYKNFPPLAKLLTEKREIDPFIQLHLFGFTHLPTPIFHFFSSLPTHFYQLSFCQEFWSDILSDRELYHLNGSSALYKFSEGAPSLLANFGIVMRKGLILFEESLLPQEEKYIEPQGETQLPTLQKKLLTFDSDLSIKADESIQIHIASSRYREVEIVANHLKGIFAQEGYKPKDILIMAPDLSLYTPFLEALIKFPITFLDGKFKEDSASVLEGMMLLLDLEKKRMSCTSVMTLFSYEVFRKKHSFTDEDLLEIREWMEKVNIRWGFNLEHKKRLLKYNEHPLLDEKNSFKEGLDRLISAIATDPTLVRLSKLELLFLFYELIYKIYADLTYLYTTPNLSLQHYLEYLSEMAARYFVDEESFSELLEQIKREGKDYLNITLSFTQVRALIDSCKGTLSVSKNKNSLNSILSASLATCSLVPAKVTFLMGVDEATFPRREIASSLDLLAKEKLREYLPLKGDFDRSFFLEAVMNCKERLYISYVETPSLIVQEFTDSLQNVTTYHHPYSSFDSSYFTTDDPHYKSYSEYAFLMAKALREKKVESAVVIPLKKKEMAPLTLDIKELTRFVKSPLKHTFKHKAGVYFSTEEGLKEEEEFTLSSLDLSLMERKSSCLAEQITTMKKKGAFPSGSFGKIAESVAYKRRAQQEALFAFHGINPTHFTTWNLNMNPLVVGVHKIVGKIENVTEQGLLVYEKGDFVGAIRAWPLFLAFSLAGGEKKQIIFGKDESRKSAFFEDGRPYLERLIELYVEAKEQPFLLLPELIEPLLAKDQERIRKILAQIQSVSFDESFHFSFRDRPLPSAQELIDLLYAKADHCYGELKDAWF